MSSITDWPRIGPCPGCQTPNTWKFGAVGTKCTRCKKALAPLADIISESWEWTLVEKPKMKRGNKHGLQVNLFDDNGGGQS